YIIKALKLLRLNSISKAFILLFYLMDFFSGLS
ncbi:hypothetical protein EDC14_105920, partial [Hydrogenispora ethanolica]